MVAALTAFFQSLTQALKAYETHLNQQSTTDVVKTKKQLKKASDVTEQILQITDQYVSKFEEKDLSRYNKLKKQFLKLN